MINFKFEAGDPGGVHNSSFLGAMAPMSLPSLHNRCSLSSSSSYKRKHTQGFSEAHSNKRSTTPAPRPASAYELLLENGRRRLENPNPCLLRSTTTEWLTLNSTGIHEIAGEGGTGKTQIALGLCIDVAQVGPTARSLYLSLQSNMIPKIVQRLAQMTQRDENGVHSPLSRIKIRSVHNQDDFLALVHAELWIELRHEPVQLIVIDSIADLFRGLQDDDANDKYLQAKRSAALFAIAAALRRLSEEFVVPILVINQVSASATLPALGLSWAHCVNTSYVVTRQEQASNGFVRRIQLVKSPLYRSGMCAGFTVEQSGVYAVDEISSPTGKG